MGHAGHGPCLARLTIWLMPRRTREKGCVRSGLGAVRGNAGSLLSTSLSPVDRVRGAPFAVPGSICRTSRGQPCHASSRCTPLPDGLRICVAYCVFCPTRHNAPAFRLRVRRVENSRRWGGDVNMGGFDTWEASPGGRSCQHALCSASLIRLRLMAAWQYMRNAWGDAAGAGGTGSPPCSLSSLYCPHGQET